MRNKMLIPALLSVVLPALSACDAVTSGPLALRSDAQREEPARRMSLMGERMGSTGGDTSPGGEQPPGETEVGTSTGGMPIEDTDGASSSTSAGGLAGDTSSGTTGEGTSSGTTAAEPDPNCPWWGCELPPGWIPSPGYITDEIVGDCHHPIGQPEVGDAKCAAHAEARGASHIPHDCVRLSEFEYFDTEPLGWGTITPMPPAGIEPAFCSPRCIPPSGIIDPCFELSIAAYGLSAMLCGSPSPHPDETPSSHCMMFSGNYPALLYLGNDEPWPYDLAMFYPWYTL